MSSDVQPQPTPDARPPAEQAGEKQGKGRGRGKGRGDQPPTDWVTRAADEAVRHADGRELVTCASGASPSGPVHLGNLREFLTVHFVADELRRRGVKTRHLHSWDDYDRFRKVPAGVDPSWAEHIGRPLSAVPDPWDCHTSWAEHFKAPLRAALAELGVEMEEISQTEMYRSGAYRDQILLAIRERHGIESVLARYRTKAAPAASEEGVEAAESTESTMEQDAVEAVPGPVGTEDLSRFPYKPYCRSCGRDTTTLLSYDDETTDLSYACTACAYEGVTNVATQDEGKLVWKVDWPMRWTYEGVDFEPGGADHATPGSSYTVGKDVVKVFGGRAPSFVAYGFVGFAGMQKMSSSAGGVPTAADALKILEPSILRWLYVRRAPKQTFSIDFGPEVVRLYDEWDALTKKAADPAKRDVAVLAHERAAATASGPLPVSAVQVPFRTLSSVADVTAGSAELISQVISSVGFPHDSVGDLQPRLAKAMQWTAEFVPAEERTTVRETPDTERLASLSADEQRWLDLLVDNLPAELTQDEVTTVVYGVPKLAHGLAVDAAPTDEVKADQKTFFKLLYNLLVDADRGPRLPTLVVALGAEKVRTLLGR
ncbi:lysine--tRNA ligase [Nocardioides jishulii]|uniref:Lysine--tRNA ligase n=1 Tax=Nocardioides jishulii TaxID=2575440 RepID=A0A4U2YQW3_9ACTN|nr:lysine--tRNA ligase [Nocardioides jishulii]QCX26369.1 lysine--tRNA ligase [Nocardioides jishulii]TKI63826.1 lysine--tRNA ligase [Nocardioides jishulii]